MLIPPTDSDLVLTVRSGDQVGIVAALSGAIARAGGNIVELGQHTDERTAGFGCRIAIEPDVRLDSLHTDLVDIAMTLQLNYTLHSPTRPRVVLMCSSELHCLSDLLARTDLGEFSCEVVAIISDRLDAKELSTRYGVAFFHLPVTPNRVEQEDLLHQLLVDLNPDLVVLARYMRILPSHITELFPERMINVHHSFLPAFVGNHPYKRAYERGVKMVGATAHYVVAELDAGPIIAQTVTPVSHADSLTDIERRGADAERAVLNQAIRLHLEHRIMVFGEKTCVFD
jgi:formyltetrahydrofolate deformylase